MTVTPADIPEALKNNDHIFWGNHRCKSFISMLSPLTLNRNNQHAAISTSQWNLMLGKQWSFRVGKTIFKDHPFGFYPTSSCIWMAMMFVNNSFGIYRMSPCILFFCNRPLLQRKKLDTFFLKKIIFANHPFGICPMPLCILFYCDPPLLQRKKIGRNIISPKQKGRHICLQTPHEIARWLHNHRQTRDNYATSLLLRRSLGSNKSTRLIIVFAIVAQTLLSWNMTKKMKQKKKTNPKRRKGMQHPFFFVQFRIAIQQQSRTIVADYWWLL